MAVGTEFIFYIMELASFLVVFLQFRKSRRRRAKSWVNGETRYWKYFGENLRKWLSRIHFIFYRWIDYSWRRSAVTDEIVKTKPQMTRFRDASVQQFGYRWNWRWQITIWLQMHKWTTKSRRKELNNWYCVCVVKPSDKTHDTNDNATTKTQSTFHTSHTNLNTWILHPAQFHVRIVQWSGLGRHDLHTTSWLKFDLCASLMSIHALSVSLRLWALHSNQLPLLFIFFQYLAVTPALLPQRLGQQ